MMAEHTKTSTAEALVQVKNLGRVVHGHGELAALYGEREDAVLLHDVQGDLAQDLGRDPAALAQVNKGHSVLLGQGLGHLLRRSETQLHQSLADLQPSAALVPEGRPPPLASPREYVPTAHPGARLPHAWLDVDGARRSSLDLVSFDRFTLVSFGAHERWAEAIESVSTVPVTQVRVGIDARLPDEAWRTTCGVEATGALLVRPDQHVAWRAGSLPAQPGASLAAAFTSILGEPI